MPQHPSGLAASRVRPLPTSTDDRLTNVGGDRRRPPVGAGGGGAHPPPPRRSGREAGSWRALRARAWAFYFAHRPAIVLGMGLYLVAVHLVALALFWESYWPGILAWKLGLGSRWVEFDAFHRAQTGLLARRAQAIAPGAALFI